MPAGKYNMIIEQGAGFSRSFTWKDSAGVAINIAGYTIRMMARVNIDDATPVITLSTVNPPAGITITNEAAGQFSIALTALQTAALKFSKAYYDLEMVPAAGEPVRLLEGMIILSPEVTR